MSFRVSGQEYSVWCYWDLFWNFITVHCESVSVFVSGDKSEKQETQAKVSINVHLTSFISSRWVIFCLIQAHHFNRAQYMQLSYLKFSVWQCFVAQWFNSRNRDWNNVLSQEGRGRGRLNSCWWLLFKFSSIKQKVVLTALNITQGINNITFSSPADIHQSAVFPFLPASLSLSHLNTLLPNVLLKHPLLIWFTNSCFCSL